MIGTLPFDIPSQPLEDALLAFDAATGIEVFVDGQMVAGRRSTAIKGTLIPVEALHALLAGTGLDAKPVGVDAITLSVRQQPEERPAGSIYHSYSALVQNAVVHALCEEPGTRPGAYRIAMRLWLDSAGTIADADLLSTTGDPQRDSRLEDILKGLPVGLAPPSGLPQPIIMVILPRPPQQSGDCS